jgi:hypothetical protein
MFSPFLSFSIFGGLTNNTIRKMTSKLKALRAEHRPIYQRWNWVPRSKHPYKHGSFDIPEVGSGAWEE